MIIWVKPKVFDTPTRQRAEIKSEGNCDGITTLIIKSCGTDKLAEIKLSDVVAVEITKNITLQVR